jgi:prepilin-type N-terminal cleavage/methylation domain-containing protein
MVGDAMYATKVGVARSERGMSLVELLVALVVLSIGVLAIGGVFPAGSRAQLQDRLTTTGSYYAQQKLEDLEGLGWGDANLTDGRHPAGSATESLGSGQWHRFYTVTTMAAPLDNLKRVTVEVDWTFKGARSVSATTYLRQ